MTQTYDYLARMPAATGKRLCEMARHDMRSLNKEIAWLIEQEHARRQQPRTPINPSVQMRSVKDGPGLRYPADHREPAEEA